MSELAVVSTKFYHFSQNNSGGSFHFDEQRGITHNVIVEANDYRHANQLAEDIGIYFDGCDSGQDCSCCGDRWYSQWGETDGKDVPSIYGEPVESQVSSIAWMPPGKETVVHYLDGRKEWFGVVTKVRAPKVKKVKK
jgi:hypothetical protein